MYIGTLSSQLADFTSRKLSCRKGISLNMSPRRSPRFKLSPKPKLPKKPRRPKRVKNPAEDSVRQANYQVELAAWEAAKVEHENKMQKRQAKQTAGWKAARKSAAEKDAPPPAAPQAALAPRPHS